MEKRQITFSPPDITEAEIEAVADTLRSGWITTGPKCKEFVVALHCEFIFAEPFSDIQSAGGLYSCEIIPQTG